MPSCRECYANWDDPFELCPHCHSTNIRRPQPAAPGAVQGTADSAPRSEARRGQESGPVLAVPALRLPAADAERKALPVFTGLLMYFPLACAAVAAVSKVGNDQHNPGEPMHWARHKSTDQMNTAVRHMMDHGMGNPKDDNGRTWHLAKAAWRILAELELAIEAEQAKE